MNAPTFPRTDTLTARALMRLLSGQQFTHRDFQNETASYRLSGYVEQLRNRHGWLIETKEENTPTNDPTGRAATYGRYLIEPDILKALRTELGERLTKFIEAVKRFESTGGVMRHNIKKPTGCVNIQQATFKKQRNHCNRITDCVKAEFMRLASWLSLMQF